MKKNNFALKILPVLIAISLIVAGYLYVDFNGNPFDASKLNKQSDAYMQENYPEIWENVHRSTNAYFVKAPITQWDKNYENYIEYDGTWQVYYTDDNDPSVYMYLVYDRDCNLIYDSCSEKYLKGAMIFEKLVHEYNIFLSNIYTEEYNNGVPQNTISMSNIIDGNFISGTFEYYNSSHIAPYEGPVLDINRHYAMEELAKEYGMVYFRYNDGISQMGGAEYSEAVDNIYKHCLEARDIVKKYNIPFNKISILQTGNEGLFFIGYEQLFDENLHQYILENYTVGQ